jgi:hypothetical protein
LFVNHFDAVGYLDRRRENRVKPFAEKIGLFIAIYLFAPNPVFFILPRSVGGNYQSAARSANNSLPVIALPITSAFE